MGAPTKLSDVGDELLRLLERGCYLEPACLQVGITIDTLDNWRAWGRDGREPYATFLTAFSEARAKAENEMVEEIRQGDTNWQSRAWLLERTRPERYRLRQTTELAGVPGQPIEVIAPTPDDRREVAEILAASGAIDP